jgi:hypothetical protein
MKEMKVGIHVFHMALDKFYGPSNKLKNLLIYAIKRNCGHPRCGLNHAFGRNPMVRMWMNDPDGDGWGSPTAESLISIPQLNIAIMWVRFQSSVARNAELRKKSRKAMD